MQGIQALRHSAATIDLSARGRIRLTGDDRARLLHAMTTNHVQQMQPGDSSAAFFLNAQGRILADTLIYCGDGFLLLSVEPEVRQKVYAHLDRYIIADDVTLEDATDSTCEIAVEGPAAVRPSGIVLDASYTGQPGFRVVLPLAEKAAFLASLGLPEATLDEARALRIANGTPRYGDDITEANLVQETGLDARLHFNKGCYLGQEIVERVRSRGHVNRRLHALRIDATVAPAPGEKVLSSGKEAGEITSAVALDGAVHALAYLRATTDLSVAGAAAQLVQGR